MYTITLLPGLLCDATVWQPLLKRLADKEVMVADFSTQDDLTDMATDCLAQQSGPLQVVGHSMGARVAMEMARIQPDRVERLVLLDTGIHPLKPGEVEKREKSVRFAYEHGMHSLAGSWLKGMLHTPHLEDADLMQSLTDMVLRCDADLHARQIKALINRPDAASYLNRIACPVLLVVGRQDQWSPVSQHEDMLELLPDARLEIIEEAGHFAPLEQAETVTHLVADFLAGSQS